MVERVTRHGDVVRRPLTPWSKSIHHLLAHLADVGFPAPRVVDIDDEYEVLTWMEGESGPHGWAKVIPEHGLRRWGAFLRRFHDAVRDYRPRDGSVWSCGATAFVDGDIVCHGDFGPWNATWNESEPVGLIDWDHARPASPLFDVAYALEYAVPFRDDATAMSWMHHPPAPNRVRRIEVFCDGYGIEVPHDVVSLLAEQQKTVLQTVQHLAQSGIEPQVQWASEGYLDVLDERIAWTRSLVL